MDYIFTPIIADRIVLKVASFADAVHKNLVGKTHTAKKPCPCFGNKVDGREKTDLYQLFEKAIGELDLPLMKTLYSRHQAVQQGIVGEKKAVFRSTLFPAESDWLRAATWKN